MCAFASLIYYESVCVWCYCKFCKFNLLLVSLCVVCMIDSHDLAGHQYSIFDSKKRFRKRATTLSAVLQNGGSPT